MAKKIKICRGPNCSKHHIEHLEDAIKTDLSLGEEGRNERYELDFCGCTGFCEQGPNVWVDSKIIHQAKADTVAQKIINDECVDVPPPAISDIKDDFLNDI